MDELLTSYRNGLTMESRKTPYVSSISAGRMSFPKAPKGFTSLYALPDQKTAAVQPATTTNNHPDNQLWTAVGYMSAFFIVIYGVKKWQEKTSNHHGLPAFQASASDSSLSSAEASSTSTPTSSTKWNLLSNLFGNATTEKEEKGKVALADSHANSNHLQIAHDYYESLKKADQHIQYLNYYIQHQQQQMQEMQQQLKTQSQRTLEMEEKIKQESVLAPPRGRGRSRSRSRESSDGSRSRSRSSRASRSPSVERQASTS
jgi:hypothetical protein